MKDGFLHINTNDNDGILMDGGFLQGNINNNNGIPMEKALDNTILPKDPLPCNGSVPLENVPKPQPLEKALPSSMEDGVPWAKRGSLKYTNDNINNGVTEDNNLAIDLGPNLFHILKRLHIQDQVLKYLKDRKSART